MNSPDARPRIDVVLGGHSVSTDGGEVGFCAVTLIEGLDEAGQPRRILVDAAHVGRRRVLWEALAQRGMGPGDIDAVVLTHAHWDHVQNVDIFSNARLLLHPVERSYCAAPHRNDWATPGWTGAVLERQPVVEVADGDEILHGVRVIDTPGHTPGSIAVTVENDDGLAVIAGDAMQRADLALSRTNPLVFWDSNAAQASIDRIVKMADVVYPGHDRPFRVGRSGAISYLVPYQLTIKRVTPDTPGLAFDSSDPGQWIMPGIEEQAAARRAFEEAAGERRPHVDGESSTRIIPW